jgi:hypothetical protein
MAGTIFVAAVLLGVLSVVSSSPPPADMASLPDLPVHVVERILTLATLTHIMPLLSKDFNSRWKSLGAPSLGAPFSKPSCTSLPVTLFPCQAEDLKRTYSQYGELGINRVILAEGDLDEDCEQKNQVLYVITVKKS